MSQEATVGYIDTAALEIRFRLLKFHLIKRNKDTISFLIHNPEVIIKNERMGFWGRSKRRVTIKEIVRTLKSH